MAAPNDQSQAIHCYGTYLLLGPVGGEFDASENSNFGTLPNANEEVAEVRTISSPSIKVTIANITHLRSPEAWKEKLGGFKDGGNFTLELNFTQAEALKLIQRLRNRYWSIISLPDGTNITMVVLIETYEPADTPEDDKIGAMVTFEIHGKVHISDGAVTITTP